MLCLFVPGRCAAFHVRVLAGFVYICLSFVFSIVFHLVCFQAVLVVSMFCDALDCDCSERQGVRVDVHGERRVN